MPSDRNSLKFYQLDVDVERVRWIGCKTDQDWRRAVRVRDHPVHAEWQPIAVEWLPETASGAAADTVHFTSVLRCFSGRSRAILSTYLDRAGEWLDIFGLDERYCLYHVLTSVDVLDWSKSEYIGDRSHLSDMLKYSLAPEDVELLPDVFRIPQVLSSFIVSQKIVDIIEECHLSGFLYSDVEVNGETV